MLGLVHRDLLLDIATPSRPKIQRCLFAAGRAVESGYELRSWFANWRV